MRNEFHLWEKPKGSKQTYLDHYEQIEKATGKTHDKLKFREKRPTLFYLWMAYLELMNRTPLTYSEIEAWARLTGRRLLADEVRMLITIDRHNKWTTSAH